MDLKQDDTPTESLQFCTVRRGPSYRNRTKSQVTILLLYITISHGEREPHMGAPFLELISITFSNCLARQKFAIGQRTVPLSLQHYCIIT